MATSQKSCISIITCNLLLNCCTQIGESRVTLTPSSRLTALCPGDWITLTCNTSTEVQQWIIEDPNTGIMYTRLIAVSNSMTQVTPLQVQSFTFNFAIISNSPPQALPLISTLSVDGVSTYLNTTRISCLEVDSGNREMVTIYILRSANSLDSVPLNYNLTDPDFGTNNVTVALLLNLERDEEDRCCPLAATFSVIAPSQVKVLSQERTRFQLIIPYSTQFNVSIVASLCGQYGTPTIIQIGFNHCGYSLPMTANTSNSVTAIVEEFTPALPLIEGAIIKFSCPPEHALIGPNVTTCMGSGEWEPDPREVQCKHTANCGPLPAPSNGHIYPFLSTLAGAHITFTCDYMKKSFLNATNLTSICSDNGTWTPNPDGICLKHSNSGIETATWTGDVLLAIISSSVTFALTTILCFIIGFINGCVCTKLTKCAKLSESENIAVNTTTNQAYEDVLPKEMRPKQKDADLKENVAYGVRSMQQ